jgi:hypothetical protein
MVRYPSYDDLTPEQRRAIEDKVGFLLTPEIVDDHNCIYAQMQKEEREAVRAFNISPDAKITVLPHFHYMFGDAGPLLDVLRRGEADADLQAWIADMIERSADGRGGFAARKTMSDRIREMGPLYDAVMDIEDVERLLRKRGGPKVEDRAAEIVAIHYDVKLEKVCNYLKRGKSARQRLPRIG